MGYIERGLEFAYKYHKSSTVNPNGRFQLPTPFRLLMKFLLAAAATLAVVHAKSDLDGCVSLLFMNLRFAGTQ